MWDGFERFGLFLGEGFRVVAGGKSWSVPGGVLMFFLVAIDLVRELV